MGIDEEGVYVVEDLMGITTNFELLCPHANKYGFYVQCCPHDNRLCAVSRHRSLKLRRWIEQFGPSCSVPGGKISTLSETALGHVPRLTGDALARLEWQFVGNRSGTHKVKCAERVCVGGDRMKGRHHYGQCYADTINLLRAKP